VGRVEEFTQEGEKFIYIDFSGITTDNDFMKAVKEAGSVIEAYPEKSVYTITNISNVKFDTHTKEIAGDYLEHNRPYVKMGIVVGLDGIKKMMVRTVMKLGGRSNLDYAFTKAQAVELLLRK